MTDSEVRKVWVVVLVDLDEDLMRVILEIFFLHFLDEDSRHAQAAKNKISETISRYISRSVSLMLLREQTVK